MRIGGVVAGHDYDGKGDKRGLFGVKRAVDEYLGDAVRDLHCSCLVWSIVK